ncbi:endonuclease/exonuclease/phosphatase family protein [Streptomyces sclerotialus]|uniref:endonuclease/exonuclease/phosphatase family protein n=1 Tax=Streptomyces sclerotialus TaxID=1957 RepID=UPI0018C9B5C2
MRSIRGTGGLAVKAASTALLALIGTATLPATQASAAVVPDRVMTWNSNGQKLGTPESLAQQVRIFQPQVVALQESCATEVRKAVKLLNQQGFDYKFKIGPGTNNIGCDGWSVNGQAIIYAKGTPIQGYREVPFADDEGPWESRAYTTFTTRLAGQRVQVINTHLSAGGHREERRSQIKELLGAAKQHSRTLILGDFNAQPGYGEMPPIWDAKFTDVDPFCKKETGRPKDDRCNGTHVKTGKKFDYILHRGVNSKKCTLRSVTEDHRVVVSDITMAAGPRVPCSVI